MIEQHHIDEILREQCARVAADYDAIDFQEEDWYRKHTWTRTEERCFVEWLVRYMIDNRLALNARRARIEAEWWAFNYGWKQR